MFHNPCFLEVFISPMLSCCFLLLLLLLFTLLFWNQRQTFSYLYLRSTHKVHNHWFPRNSSENPSLAISQILSFSPHTYSKIALCYFNQSVPNHFLLDQHKHSMVLGYQKKNLGNYLNNNESKESLFIYLFYFHTFFLEAKSSDSINISQTNNASKLSTMATLPFKWCQYSFFITFILS